MPTNSRASAALSPPKRERASHHSPAAVSVGVYLSPTDRRKLDETIARLASLVGLKVSQPILLRAGINALVGFSNEVEAEQRRNPDRKGYKALALAYWLTSAARSIASA